MEEGIEKLLRSDQVTEAAIQWYGTGETELLDDVSNFVYEFDSQNERRILRLTHSSHRSEDQIVAELDWLQYLIQNGVPANQPVKSQNDRLTERFPVEDSYFVATVFEYAPGHLIDPNNPLEWNPPFFQTWGRTMGRMHRLTKHYHADHLIQKRPHWLDEDLLQLAKTWLPDDLKEAVAELDNLLTLFKDCVPAMDSYGLVHSDLNPTNFHICDGDITLFDFDDCAYNWFINDIAVTMPLYSKIFEEVSWKPRLIEFFKWFMQGYQEENHLDESWMAFLPDCLRLQNLITLISLYQSNIPNSQYHSFYELVLKTYKQGHPLFTFDFQDLYRSFVREFNNDQGDEYQSI